MGPAGPGTRATYTAIVESDGAAVVALPASAGTSLSDPPSLTCYMAPAGGTAWLAVAGSASTNDPYCGLVFVNGTFSAVLNAATPGWTAAFVVVR